MSDTEGIEMEEVNMSKGDIESQGVSSPRYTRSSTVRSISLVRFCFFVADSESNNRLAGAR